MTACALEEQGQAAGLYFTAADLMSTTFPEPRWAVPGLVAEGLNLLVGSPKLGKSWLCLGLAVAIASGGMALGKVGVDPGEVLYAALEDTPRRLQDRLQKVLHDEPVPDRLSFITALPRMPDAIGYIEGWLEAHPEARLVIIDVLRKVRPPADTRSGMYADDYDVMSALKNLADRHSVAVLAVHHTRKATDEGDVFNEVSGSTGLTGAADAILIAKRARNTAEAVLHVTGRDVTEQEYGLTWDAEACSWSLLDEPALVTGMSATRRRILDHLLDVNGARAGDIAQAIGMAEATVRQNLRRMVDAAQLDTDGGGLYFPPASLSQVSRPSRASAAPRDSRDSRMPLSASDVA